MMWRGFGMFMIIPTIGFALFITWKSRHSTSELFHNLAIIFWIIANSFWMAVDFFELEEKTKNFAIIPFSIGLILIVTYNIKALLTQKIIIKKSAL